MKGAEIESEGSVLKYITKSKIDKHRSSLRIMTQRLLLHNITYFRAKTISILGATMIIIVVTMLHTVFTRTGFVAITKDLISIFSAHEH